MSDSPYIIQNNEYNQEAEIQGGTIKAGSDVMMYAVYGVMFVVILLIFYNGYACFCKSQSDYDLEDHDEPHSGETYIEEFIDQLNDKQDQNLGSSL